MKQETKKIIVKERFVNKLEDLIYKVFYPNDHREYIKENAGKIALSMQDASMNKKITFLKEQVLSLFETKLDECEDRIALDCYLSSDKAEQVISIIKNKLND